MKTKLQLSAFLLTAALHCGAALADCGGATLSEVTQAFQRAQALEREGKQRAALDAYVRAQDYACEANPNEAAAAQRAAALSLPLAKAAEQQGDSRAAFDIYEAGGHYQAADRALIASLQANPDSPQLFEQVRTHFEHRALPAFESNNAVRLKITGAYRVNPKNISDLLAMPAQGVERALQKDAAVFNEQYLREYVQLIESQPELSTDMSAVQRSVAAHQAFAQKWPQHTGDDAFRASRDALTVLRQWAGVTRDADLSRSAERAFVERIEAHVAVLTQRYSGAPKLLEAAMDYARMRTENYAAIDAQVAKIKSQASRLADQAGSKGRYQLAADFYSVADQDDKAQAMRDRQRQVAMQNMQPSIDAMQRQAEQLRAQFSPETVKAMQAQAEAMRRSLQQPAR